MQFLGIYLDPPFLRLALLEKKRGKLSIVFFKSVSTFDTNEVKPLYIPRFKGQIVSTISARDLMIRPIELKGVKGRHTDQIVSFQAEALSFLDPSEVVVAPLYFSKRKEQIEGLLFKTLKSSVHESLEELKKLEIDPDILTAFPLALAAYIEWKSPESKEAILIDLGFSGITSICIEKGRLAKSHFFPIGIEALLAALWEDRKKILLAKELEGFAKQIDLTQLKPHLNPNLSAKVSELKHELGKTIFSITRSSPPKELFFTGRVDAFNHFQTYLAEIIKETIGVDWTAPPPSEHQKQAIPIGLCLCAARNNCVQFRQGSFFPKRKWVQLGKYLFLLGLASFFMAILAFGIATRIEKQRKADMLQPLQQLAMKEDPSLAAAIFQPNASPEEILNRWNQKIAVQLSQKHLNGNPIKVSQALSWLSNHPIIEAMKKENDPLQILQFEFHLESYPNLQDPAAHYKAKIDLEFRLNNPINARKFHESFLLQDSMIDQTQAITWEPQSDSYRTSFYLKEQN